MIRKIDNMNRLCIPKEWARQMKLEANDEIKLHYNENKQTVTFSKHSVGVKCVFCEEKDPMEVLVYNKNYICKKCFKNIKENLTIEGE